MKQLIVCLFIFILCNFSIKAQSSIDSIIPIRGLAIAAPSVRGIDNFVKFIEEELAPAHFNTLILRIDYNYAYKKHPELQDENPLTQQDVDKIINVCKKYNIDVVPQVNLLGHQSWAFKTLNLLRVYPQFDETPHIKMDSTREGEKYEWPNNEGLYCKSYCPLHPDVHNIVFDLIDEIMDAFGANTFHAGMDEVFYIGDDNCPRCSGHDKAELYAGEVTTIRNYLTTSGRKMMIWGDRLIDGKTTGIGAWEASMNQTYRAIDMIPKDIIICDWHYKRPELTSVYFATKGFNVVSCPWNKVEVAKMQIADMLRFRRQVSPQTSANFRGIIHTVWTGNEAFLENYYNPDTYKKDISDAVCLKAVMEEFTKLGKTMD